MIFQARQGDLLITSIDKIPEKGLVPKPNNIVLEGEMTGHHHKITNGQVLAVQGRNRVASRPEDLTFAYIKADQATQLVHPEHGSIELPAGQYEVRRQIEAVGEGFRLVAD